MQTGFAVDERLEQNRCTNVFVVQYCVTWYMDCPTPTAAAR